MLQLWAGDLVEVTGPDFEGQYTFVGALGVVVTTKNQERFEVVLTEGQAIPRRTWFSRSSVRGWEEAPTDDPEALERWLAS